jgi:hypothetical protein
VNPPRARHDITSCQLALSSICRELTATETLFPEINLRLIYELGSEQIPGDQEV